jgi:hypothetical protein
MNATFLTKSRHGTIYYFRRRVPTGAQEALGRSVVLRSLETSDRRLAIVRGRALAAYTDAIFQKIMATKSGNSHGSQWDYTLEIDFNEFGKPKKMRVEAEPHEEDAVNSAIKAALSASSDDVGTMAKGSGGKPFGEAVAEYFAKANIKPQSKATHRSKLEHAHQFFGATADALKIDQAHFVRYTDHVLATVKHVTTQGHYIATVLTFLNWHRVRVGLPQLTSKSLMPKKHTPESEDRDAYTLEQLRLVFENAATYRGRSPCKFWASVVPAFLGCRIEELAQVHLTTDLHKDDALGVWYFKFDGRPDPDGVTRKSLKKLASWRSVPIHEALVRHGLIEFLQRERKAGFTRPFEREWKPREIEDSDVGRIIKWSQYVTKWGGRELDKLSARHQFNADKLGYFHSMRHTFKQVLGAAGVSSEISEALSGRRYGGADATRYEKLKSDHARLYREGIQPGLVLLARMLNEILEAPKNV